MKRFRAVVVVALATTAVSVFGAVDAGARQTFTAVSATPVELDGDGHADDVEITFLARTGTTTTVVATREVRATCVTVWGDAFVTDAVEQIAVTATEPEDPSETGRWDPEVTATVEFRTVLYGDGGEYGDNDPAAPVCGTTGSDTNPYLTVAAVKDYTVTYTAIAITDSRATAYFDPVEPYHVDFDPHAHGYVATPDLELLGLECTIRSFEAGECNTF